MTYFANIKTLEELKKEYRKLAFKFHPDRGGNVETMAIINAEYDKMLKIVSTGKSENNNSQQVNIDDGFRQVIDAIITCEGLEIEICGSWIWVGGNTVAHKTTLKENGYRWASKKKMWYWRPADSVCRATKMKDMDYIRNMYGSIKIENEKNKRIAGN